MSPHFLFSALPWVLGLCVLVAVSAYALIDARARRVQREYTVIDISDKPN
jgi:hypothetical protein